MDRRGFLRLLGIGLALGPEAIAEAMKPQIFYSIPASVTPAGGPFDYGPYDEVLRRVYQNSVYELINQKSSIMDLFGGDEWAEGPVTFPLITRVA